MVMIMNRIENKLEGLYFLEITKDYIVVNDRYEGILLLDDNLNIRKKYIL